MSRLGSKRSSRSSPAARPKGWGFSDYLREFGRFSAALKNLRQAEASMDTLVSVGVLAAYGWSTYALFFTEAGDAGMKMPTQSADGRACCLCGADIDIPSRRTARHRAQ